jgi:tryptophan-rich sensory protein
MKYILPLLVIFTSVIGSLSNIYINSDDWYSGLIKSPLNPPSYIFGIVWPILYAIMAFVSFQVSEKISTLFMMQLAFNATWSWLFFYFHAPVLAFLDISILILLNVEIVRILRRETTALFYLYLPYIIWLLFAAFLNASIIFLN